MWIITDLASKILIYGHFDLISDQKIIIYEETWLRNWLRN